MALLSVHLLGRFQIALDGTPLMGFATDKTRALLAFLATECERPHRRQALAGLLWPDYPERSARTSLRTALANLRLVIGDRQAAPPFLLITRQTVAVNCDSDIWTDVTAFSRLLDPRQNPLPTIPQLEEAVTLYQGEFLAGFSLADSALFDQWVLTQREQMKLQMVAALGWLARGLEELGDHRRALQHARRRVELDPFQEPAQRELMRLLAITGRRADALLQYADCRRLLADDLGVEPDEATTRLYHDIREGRLGDSDATPAWTLDSSASLPQFLNESIEVEVERPVFVGRERELRRLHTHLGEAMARREQVVFVIGGAGRGKTLLLEEFVRQVQGEQPVVVATGYCNAYSGGGDPYLPFRQVLEMLTGDVDDLWAAGRITREHAMQLWEVLPVTAKAIVEVGPDLIETFLSGRLLLERTAAAASSGAAWLPRLGRLVRARTASQGPADLEQQTLIDQYARVLEHLAQHLPLILILEDLHWADRGSVELLLHIGRRLARSRILLLGAYRPDELATRGNRGPHPLAEGVDELRSLYGEIVIDLALENPETDWRFVNDLLDVEPNRLGGAFRQALYDRTGGHPLFTVEMLRMLQEQGDLWQDSQGRWVEGQSLAWDDVPARVEAVIQKRVGRLDPLMHEHLTVASVEGEDLTAEVVARVLNRPEHKVLRSLSRDLGRKHRLLRERGELKIGEQSLSRYRFSHHLIQRYVYNTLSAGERRRLHRAVARALEDLFSHDLETVTIPLAYHYGHAAAKDKTLHYLTEAGHQARKRYDGQQAVHYYTEALALVPEDSSDRFGLLAARAAVGDLLGQREDQKTDLDAMEALALRLEDPGLLCDALLAMSDFYLVTEIFRAREPAQRALAIARGIPDSVREARALRLLSWEGRLGADFETSRVYLKEAAARFQEAGLPGEAASCLFMLMRRLGGAAKHVFELDDAKKAMALSQESGDYRLQAAAKRNLAIAYAYEDRYADALPLAREALTMQRDLGDRPEQCSTLDVLGIILARLGRREEAAKMFQRCLALSEEIGSDWGILGAVFGFWNYWYIPIGERERYLAFMDERLDFALANDRVWLSGFLTYMRTYDWNDLGQYAEALAQSLTETHRVTEGDLLSHVFVVLLDGAIRAELGQYEEARRDLEDCLVLAEKTSDRYLPSWPLVALARLALYEGTEESMRHGLAQARWAKEVAQEVREERQWGEALDVSARLHLALGQPEAAYEASSQAMGLLAAHPWLPKPQNHLFTHSLALRALGREAEADDHLRCAYERVMFVADKFTDEAMRQGWLQNVRVNREILGNWEEIQLEVT